MKSNIQGSFFDLNVRHRGTQLSIFVRSFRSFTTIAHVAQAAHVGQRFVQGCFEAVVQEIYAKQGRAMNETTPLSTPCFLGIDEFAHRKGHRYDTILCDLVNRTVLEVSEGRTLEDVQRLLERLSCPDAVKAVSMDMSASFRPAVQKCWPHVTIVVDHFHVIQHVMKAFKKILQSWAQRKEGTIFCTENNTFS